MKNLFPILLLAAFVTLAARCGSDNDFEMGESFTLQLEEAKTNKTEGLTVQWKALPEDSRCPKNTNCVWEGQARMTVLVNDEEVEVILHAGHPGKAKAEAGGYVVKAEELEPYPDMNVDTQPEDYVLHLQVNKAP